MNNSERLKEIINSSGYKIVYLANGIGLTYQGFVNKINDISRFKAYEIGKICELLKINDTTRNEIFFNLESED